MAHIALSLRLSILQRLSEKRKGTLAHALSFLCAGRENRSQVSLPCSSPATPPRSVLFAILAYGSYRTFAPAFDSPASFREKKRHACACPFFSLCGTGESVTGLAAVQLARDPASLSAFRHTSVWLISHFRSGFRFSSVFQRKEKARLRMPFLFSVRDGRIGHRSRCRAARPRPRLAQCFSPY